ncbi:MAG TPA: sigma 54-interacting transcriptional regulator [Myxococcota bacterium]|nr:sigma 54-interacting transcriptional regulator [Myxococcota bacterium]HQK50013.1 sigma 54-interacting transcriptional regulator [Myxococcota bacterium]
MDLCLLAVLVRGRVRRFAVGPRAAEVPWAPGVRVRLDRDRVVVDGERPGLSWRPGEARVIGGLRTSCLAASRGPFGVEVRLGPGLVGVSEGLVRAFHLAVCAAGTRDSVLILGESGTGKELLARAIHDLGGPGRPWVAVNLAAVPRDLAEGELFGWVPGAFTGAASRRVGAFEAATGGTLLLDEVGEASGPIQAKVLRCLEEGRVTRLGSTREVPVETRVLAATNRDPSRAVAEGRLRLDLVQRLACLVIRLPPLRERPEDLPVLARHLCRGPVPEGLPDPEALDLLRRWPWPGNVRELRNVVRRAEALCGPGALGAVALEDALALGGGPIDPGPRPSRGERRRQILASGLPRSTWYYRRRRGTLGPDLDGEWASGASPALAENGEDGTWEGDAGSRVVTRHG